MIRLYAYVLKDKKAEGKSTCGNIVRVYHFIGLSKVEEIA